MTSAVFFLLSGLWLAGPGTATSTSTSTKGMSREDLELARYLTVLEDLELLEQLELLELMPVWEDDDD